MITLHNINVTFPTKRDSCFRIHVDIYGGLIHIVEVIILLSSCAKHFHLMAHCEAELVSNDLNSKISILATN